jgi:hypothetical protein
VSRWPAAHPTTAGEEPVPSVPRQLSSAAPLSDAVACRDAHVQEDAVSFIAARFQVQPEHADRWREEDRSTPGELAVPEGRWAP